jgi:hypothetical protein
MANSSRFSKGAQLSRFLQIRGCRCRWEASGGRPGKKVIEFRPPNPLDTDEGNLKTPLGTDTMAQLPVEKARRFVSLAFLGYTQKPIPPTEEGEKFNIKGTLKALDMDNRRQIHRSIIAKTLANGYQTSLADFKFTDENSLYDTVGDIVTDLINSIS